MFSFFYLIQVYPPDQHMVFNPQNPNAPPIYPCGICHKEVHDNDQAILCESGCNFWFHRICTGLTEAAYHLLTAEVYAEWVCDKCLATKNIPLVKFRAWFVIKCLSLPLVSFFKILIEMPFPASQQCNIVHSVLINHRLPVFNLFICFFIIGVFFFVSHMILTIQ